MALLLVAILTTGCSSINNLKSDKPMPYGGVTESAATVAFVSLTGPAELSADGPMALLGVPLLAGDFVCAAGDLAGSIVVDTLTLPWSVYRVVQPGPPLLAPSHP